ncbi:MAG: hypothetical protein WKF75_18200, partial [Singulisphaera sp.]
SAPEPSGPVRLTLAPTVEVAVRVLDPEGSPVAGASVAVVFLNGDGSPLPDELAGRLGTTTDTAGRAVLKAAPPEAILMVRVTTGDHGAQVFIPRRGLKPGTDLRLRPVARVEGRVSSADPASARGLHVYLSTFLRDQSKGQVSGSAEAVTDARGRFAVPALAAGELSVDVPTPEGSLLRALRPAVTAIEEKGKAEVEIPLKRLLRVRGVVREKGTAKPVADVVVRLFSRDVANDNSLPSARTDAEGRFEALALPSPKAEIYVNPPPAFLRAMRSTEVNVGDADGQTLPRSRWSRAPRFAAASSMRPRAGFRGDRRRRVAQRPDPPARAGCPTRSCRRRRPRPTRGVRSSWRASTPGPPCPWRPGPETPGRTGP